MKKYFQIATVILATTSFSAMAAKSCDQLKTELAAKLDAKAVKNYSLNIVAADAVKEAKVIGSCDGNTKRITYIRN